MIMPKIERSALLPYAADDLFELVNQVEDYPQYMSGCVGVDVLSRSDDHLEARLHLSKAGVKQSFTTRNQLTKPTKMVMTLVDGPFKQFSGEWTFVPLGESASKVNLNLEFEMNSGILQAAASKLFEYTANEMLDALVKRANERLKKS
jgi:ribosome-associated toxin RatA of RatAB toxin-antitoxin module